MIDRGYKTIRHCRVCYSELLEKAFDIGTMCVSDFVDDPKLCVMAPLSLVLCRNCSLIQLRQSAPPEMLYRVHYWYRSRMNPVIETDLKNIVEEIYEVAGEGFFGRRDAWIDVGANDGTLLKYVSPNIRKVGVEPAENLQKELMQHANVVYPSFWENTSLNFKAKVITAIGMFYDSEDPNVFMAKVKQYLDEDGLFVSQFMTAKAMLDMNDVGNICHEHLEYYTYKSLVTLFERNRLEIFKVEENSINGGSYRIFARHFSKGSIAYPEPITMRTLHNFAIRVKHNRDQTAAFIRSLSKQGKKVYAYGASTKGNTIVQYYGISRSLKGAADKDETKWGKYMVGSNVKIVSEEEARKEADYFFILPWAFTDAFVEREKEWHEKGGKFIVSIPEFRVI